jgi:RNA polymerase sigma factor (sigma-70 family)
MHVLNTQHDLSARPQTDAELVARALQGEAAAFEAIMRRHNRLLFRCVRGVLGDDAEAQDVVQDAYLRAFGSLQTFRADAALSTWLARIALNLAFDALRRKGRSVPLDESHDFDAEPRMQHSTAFNAPDSAGPDAQAERSEMRALLQRAIDSLPPLYRSVFVLRAVEELSVAETAACLQVSDDVVKTRYLRARALLRDALGAQAEAHMSQVLAFAGARCDAVVAHVLGALQREGRLRP